MTAYRPRSLHTPKLLKILILISAALSLALAFLEGFFPSFSLQHWLCLSQSTLSHYYLWQLATYLFIYPSTQSGLSFSLFLSLAFNAYVLWMIGTTLIHRKGIFHFLALYFLGGIAAGGLIASLQYFLHIPALFAGNWTALYALLIAWVMLYPEIELLLLLTLPIKGKWLVLSMLGINLLIDLSTGAFLAAAGYFLAALIGYLYGVCALRTLSPFPLLHPFERKILHLLSKTKQSQTDASSFAKSKIYDFKTGKAILNDQEFLEAMLTKISMHGKKSISWKEKWRLKKLSKARS